MQEKDELRAGGRTAGPVDDLTVIDGARMQAAGDGAGMLYHLASSSI